MKRIEFLVGIEKDANERQVDRVEERLEAVRNILREEYNAFTEFDSKGYWNGVGERGKVFLVLTDSNYNRATAQRIARAMKQSCVGLVIQEARFSLVDASDGIEHLAASREKEAFEACAGMKG